MRSQARKALEALPLIKQASVRKLYPDRVVIDIVERDAGGAVAEGRRAQRHRQPTAR